jgi:hypothetical protein
VNVVGFRQLPFLSWCFPRHRWNGLLVGLVHRPSKAPSS